MQLLKKFCLSLNAGKSQGPDYIHPKFLKETKDVLVEPLKIIKWEYLTSYMEESQC